MSGQCTGWVLRHGPKDRAMKAVLITVADAANRDGEHAHPGIEAMCEGSLYGRRHVFGVLRRLVDEGWLEVEEEGGGRGKATVYRVPMVIPRNGALDAPMPDGNGAIGDAKGCNPRRETVQSSDPAPITSTVTTNGTTSTGALVLASPTFDDFWAAYPRHEAKQAARSKWHVAIRRAEPAAIVAGALRYAADPNRDPAFTAHPTTWLNQGRWEDDPLPARGGAVDTRQNRTSTALGNFVNRHQGGPRAATRGSEGAARAELGF